MASRLPGGFWKGKKKTACKIHIQKKLGGERKRKGEIVYVREELRSDWKKKAKVYR